MIKIGDKLIAKNKTLYERKLDYNNREMVVDNVDKGNNFIILRFHTEESDSGFGFFHTNFSEIFKEFMVPDTVNYEISKLAEDELIQFKSFKGVTTDGKIIEVKTE